MLKSRNWWALVTGIIFILMAVLMFINPLWPLAAMGWLFAIAVFVDGIISLADYLSRQKHERSGWHLFLAVITIILGVSLLGDTLIEQAVTVPLLLAFWMIFVGVGRLMLAIQGGTLIGKQATAFLLLSGILTLLLAFVIMIEPWLSGAFFVYLVAISFIIFGVFRIYEFFTQRIPVVRVREIR
ncbi:hypothetical protein BSR29_05305 [Boudabousia liubingyangii]|uniref:HdeD family acid-resistance protein n=1 Tax=Boudabousia liubingyangii TaxID=1921764 RepID=A0A1Q5PLI2_9ACTO|nr:DUF308 domain-containing protein [Boudabousia liubingyangii]OKL47903.1 hypothetical protein BSR29_05305 [Boudabousia liubingyangii]